MKTCSKCKTTKEDSEFGFRRGKLVSWCKKCLCEAARMRRLKDPEAARREDREWYARNIETIRARNREDYHKNSVASRASSAKWKKENPGYAAKATALRRFRAYGITQEEFQKLLDSQSGKCKICSVTLDSSNKNLVPCVDHDHGSKKIRGILCKLCNVGLGNFKDCFERLEKAAEYLKKHS